MKKNVLNPSASTDIRRPAFNLSDPTLDLIARATLVATNRDLYAVAIRYQRENDLVPIVIAKGTYDEALQIRLSAVRRGVPILDKPNLVTRIYPRVVPNSMAPIEYFGEIAELLASVSEENESPRNPTTWRLQG